MAEIHASCCVTNSLDHGTTGTRGWTSSSRRQDLFLSQVRLEHRGHHETGDVVRTIGRQGEGPGDFKLLSAIWFRGDTLVASDRQLFRVSYFDTDGRFLDSRRRTADVAPNPADYADYRVLFFPGAPPSTILTGDGDGRRGGG